MKVFIMKSVLKIYELICTVDQYIPETQSHEMDLFIELGAECENRSICTDIGSTAMNLLLKAMLLVCLSGHNIPHCLLHYTAGFTSFKPALLSQ